MRPPPPPSPPLLLLLLLLLPFTKAGVDGDTDAAPSEGGFDLAFPCEGLVCFRVWELGNGPPSDYVAVVGNGRVGKSSASAGGAPKCTLDVRDLAAGYAGHDRRCEERPDVFTPGKSALQLKLAPGNTLTLRCVLLAHVQRGRCDTRPPRRVTLAWVDQTGAEVRRDSRHRIKRDSDCDVTLTAVVQRRDNKRFRCRATAGAEEETSVEVRVRVPARKGRGRGIVADADPRPQGGGQRAVGAAVAVLGCAALAALAAALFAVRRRRASSQRPDESRLTPGADNTKSEDAVIYANIVHPAACVRDGTRQHESTDYACVRLG